VTGAAGSGNSPTRHAQSGMINILALASYVSDEVRLTNNAQAPKINFGSTDFVLAAH